MLYCTHGSFKNIIKIKFKLLKYYLKSGFSYPRSPPTGWSGTSWTGGLAQGCAPAFKTSASVNDIPASGVLFSA